MRKVVGILLMVTLVFSISVAFAAPAVKWVKSDYVSGLQVPVGMHKKVYYIESFLADVAHRMMVSGAERAFKQMGWDCEVLNPENDLQRQIKMVEDSLAKGDMDAMIISAVDSEGIGATVKKVSDRNIPVVVVDRWPSLGKMTFGVGGDWYTHGKTATQEMVKRLTKKNGSPKGKVIAMIIGMEVNALRDRATAFRDVMKKYPNIKVIEKTAPADPVKDAQVLKDALIANPDADAIWNIADVFGMNYVATMKEIGMLYPVGNPKHIILCSMDGTDWALEEIRNGNFDSTVSSNLIEWGYMAAWSLGQHFGGKQAVLNKVGQLKVSGAGWKAQISSMGNGPYLGINSVLVIKDNVDNKMLWGNRVKEFVK